MKKAYYLFILTTILFGITGCEKKADTEVIPFSEDVNESEADDSSYQETNDNTTDKEIMDATESVEETDSSIKDGTLTFETLSKYNYTFCSGAGGWSTEFNIEKDGYFHGIYIDDDMGICGEDYPDGTRYCSNFTGHFSDLMQVDEFTYEMTLEDISYKDEVGKEEIDDGVMYIYTDAYGIAGTSKFRINLPGKPISEIDEEVYWWYQMVNTSAEVLTDLYLENIDQKEGIYTDKRAAAKEDANMIFSNYKASYDEYGENVANSTTTMDMIINLNMCYECADNCLNDLWIILKYNTDEQTFQKILEEQRAWLKERDELSQAAADSWEGGSFAEVDALDTKATMTLERCEVLLTYIK